MKLFIRAVLNELKVLSCYKPRNQNDEVIGYLMQNIRIIIEEYKGCMRRKCKWSISTAFCRVRSFNFFNYYHAQFFSS